MALSRELLRDPIIALWATILMLCVMLGYGLWRQAHIYHTIDAIQAQLQESRDVHEVLKQEIDAKE